MRIAVVAPACPIDRETADRVLALAPDGLSLAFHPQCFLAWGHFAGTDAQRLSALVDAANDPGFDAVWFARGGYGSNRIAANAIGRMDRSADGKYFVGYSDAGFLLAGLAARGIGRPVHAPMPADIRRAGGEAAVLRTLRWLANPAPAPTPRLAFNMVVLSHLLGTPLEPDFSGRELWLEEVDEHHYRIDRTLFHITASANVRRAAGIRLGRCLVPENDRPFFGPEGGDTETIVRHWCRESGIPFLGHADIGHDTLNAVIPFA